MLNLIVAVINDTYAEIKAEEDSRPDEDFPIGLYIESKFEDFYSAFVRVFSFCVEDNTPIWEALDRYVLHHFNSSLGSKLHLKWTILYHFL